jgi:hypothetical protein
MVLGLVRGVFAQRIDGRLSRNLFFSANNTAAMSDLRADLAQNASGMHHWR